MSLVEKYCGYDMSRHSDAQLFFNENDRCEPICLRGNGVEGEGAGEPELCSDSNGGFTQCQNSSAIQNKDHFTNLADCCNQTVCKSGTAKRSDYCAEICPPPPAAPPPGHHPHHRHHRHNS